MANWLVAWDGELTQIRERVEVSVFKGVWRCCKRKEASVLTLPHWSPEFQVNRGPSNKVVKPNLNVKVFELQPSPSASAHYYLLRIQSDGLAHFLLQLQHVSSIIDGANQGIFIIRLPILSLSF